MHGAFLSVFVALCELLFSGCGFKMRTGRLRLGQSGARWTENALPAFADVDEDLLSANVDVSNWEDFLSFAIFAAFCLKDRSLRPRCSAFLAVPSLNTVHFLETALCQQNAGRRSEMLGH